VDHVPTRRQACLKFGGDLHYNKVTNAAYGNARGSITFLGGVATAVSTPLEDFFAGLPFKSSVEVGNPTLHLHNWAYAGFFQDDWRVSSESDGELWSALRVQQRSRGSEQSTGKF
jgi:hypothetical protein